MKVPVPRPIIGSGLDKARALQCLAMAVYYVSRIVVKFVPCSVAP